MDLTLINGCSLFKRSKLLERSREHKLLLDYLFFWHFYASDVQESFTKKFFLFSLSTNRSLTSPSCLTSYMQCFFSHLEHPALWMYCTYCFFVATVTELNKLRPWTGLSVFLWNTGIQYCPDRTGMMQGDENSSWKKFNIKTRAHCRLI